MGGVSCVVPTLTERTFNIYIGETKVNRKPCLGYCDIPGANRLNKAALFLLLCFFYKILHHN